MEIPKKIHYCWFGEAKKNKLFDKCCKSWQVGKNTALIMK